MRASIQSCSFVRRRGFVPRFARIQPHFSEAARSRLPSSLSLTQYFPTAAGDRIHRTFWNESKKKMERSSGTQSESAHEKSRSNQKRLTKCTPVWLTRSSRGPEKLLARNLA